MDRRGNDQADVMAAKGRSQHEIDEWLKGWLKVIEHTVSTYHKWTAFTAAAQHNGEISPDHEIREDPRRHRPRVKEVRTPKNND